MTRNLLIDNPVRMLACFTLVSMLTGTALLTARRCCFLGALPWRTLQRARRRLRDTIYRRMAFPVF